MPFFFAYILKLSICLSAVYLFYQLVLRRLTFYTWNRWYLLGYTLLSFALAFVNLTPLLERNQMDQLNVVQLIPELTAHDMLLQDKGSGTGQGNTWLTLLWLAGVFAGALFFVVKYLSYLRLKQKGKLLVSGNVRVYHVAEDIIPFSFGNNVFINEALHTPEELQEIIRHEFVHVRQKHTADMLWGEMLCVLNWFNPFAWLLRRAIRQNLEFIADDNALQSGIDRKTYQYLLLKVMGNNAFSIAPHFNFSSLKKRIAMMNKMKTARVHLVRFLFVLPLLVILLLAFRSRTNEVQSGPDLPVGLEQFLFADTVKKPTPAPPAPEAVPNKKGYVLTVADNQGECVVIVKDRDRKIVTAVTLVEWDKNKKQFEEKYGVVPPPPPPAPVEQPDATPAIPVVPAAPARGVKAEAAVVAEVPVAVEKPVAAPLYIIDGKEVEQVKEIESVVRPQDVRSVNVLKGSSALEKYGKKGANGVVEITTNRSPLSIGNFKGLILVDGKELPAGKNLDEVIPDPGAIQSVNVLKGSEAVQKYGADATEGVIEILLKKNAPEPVTLRGSGSNYGQDSGNGEVLLKITRNTTRRELEQLKSELDKKGYVFKVENVNFNDGQLVEIRAKIDSKTDSGSAHFNGEDFETIIVVANRAKDGPTRIHVRVSGNHAKS